MTDLLQHSLRTYFQSKFTDDKMSGSTFWKTVKPCLTNKGHHNGCDLQLSEGGRIITDQKEVAETITIL